MADPADLIPIPDGDFRRVRSYLAPHAFATWWEGDDDTQPPPTDLIPEEDWDNVITLPTDVLLNATSYDGSWVSRINKLATDWLDAMPIGDESAFMSTPSIIAWEEFDAFVFNAVHGFFRQALGCLRNVLEVLTVAASLAVTNDTSTYDAWQDGNKVIMMGQARPRLAKSPAAQTIDAAVKPRIFGEHRSDWLNRRYTKLCSFTHGRPGARNMDFWQSNGPVYVPEAFPVVESELRETLALSYLLLKIGWEGYEPREGSAARLLSGPAKGWKNYHPLLVAELT